MQLLAALHIQIAVNEFLDGTTPTVLEPGLPGTEVQQDPVEVVYAGVVGHRHAWPASECCGEHCAAVGPAVQVPECLAPTATAAGYVGALLVALQLVA